MKTSDENKYAAVLIPVFLSQFLFCVFRSFCTVFRTSLSSLSNSCCIKCTTDNVVSCTRQVLNSSSADHNNAMLLKVVSFARNVACYFDSVKMCIRDRYRTTKKIHNILEQSGIEIIELGTDTGLVGKLEGQDGPSIGLRADIDAIPQHEQSGRTDCSLTDGIMHGCGHDTHTVSLLGAAMLLSSYREKLKGDVYFIFQPAEETLSGARYLIDLSLIHI